MACPFLDPSMLARLPAEKREEMKEMYHRMKQDQSDHLKIDIKEEDIDDHITPEQMMMGMTGGSSAGPAMTGCPVMGGGAAQVGTCPMSGGSSGEQPTNAPPMDF